MSHPVDLLRRALAAEPSRPLVTFYDDATGERVEFSVKTFDNWVAKTANLLVDGLGAEPGARVALALPVHWQTAVWLFACWSAGLTAVPVGRGRRSRRTPTSWRRRRTGWTRRSATGAEVVGLSLHSLGAPLAAVPARRHRLRDRGARATATASARPCRPDAPAVEVGGEIMTGAELVAAAEALGLPDRRRMLTTASYATTVKACSPG